MHVHPRWAILAIAFCATFSVLASPVVIAQPKPVDKDAQQKAALAKALTDLGEFALLRNMIEEAKDWVGEALKLAPEYKDAQKLKDKADKANGAPSDADKTAYQRKLDTEGKRLAKMYYDLFAAGNKAAPKDKPNYEPYLARAYQLDVKAMRPVVDSEVEAAKSAGDFTRALRLLAMAQKIKEDDKFAAKQKELELKVAENQPVLRQCKTHPMAYYLLLPKGWNKNKKWPIIVGAEGAGCNYQGYCSAYVGARGNMPFIVITPNTFTNTGELNKSKYPLYTQEMIDEINAKPRAEGRMKFDEEGVLAAVAEVQKEFNGEEKFFVTGFSGGGHICWRMVFMHPDKLMGACPGCGNFSYSDITPGPVSSAVEKETLPIKAFQGDKDEYLHDIHGNKHGLMEEWADCEKALQSNGYKIYSQVMLPGVGHSGCVDKVLEFCNEIYTKANDPKKPK